MLNKLELIDRRVLSTGINVAVILDYDNGRETRTKYMLTYGMDTIVIPLFATSHLLAGGTLRCLTDYASVISFFSDADKRIVGDAIIALNSELNRIKG